MAEAQAFLTWLAAHNFTFLGFRDYALTDEGGEVRITEVAGSGLGILRHAGGQQSSRRFDKLPAGVRALAHGAATCSSSRRPTRARRCTGPAYLDYVGVKRFDESGRVRRRAALPRPLHHRAYHASPSDIPILRRKVEEMLERAGFPPGSHDEKALIEILETHPRDELFQMPTRERSTTSRWASSTSASASACGCSCAAIRSAASSPASCSCRATASTPTTGARIEEILRDAFGAPSVDYDLRLSESVLVRLHYIVCDGARRTCPTTTCARSR